MIDIRLRAPDEAALRADLGVVAPWLTGQDESGAPLWRTAGHGFAFDAYGMNVNTPATFDAGGNITAPAVIDARFHANLRLWGDFAAQAAAFDAAPFPNGTETITPLSPSVLWA